MSDKCTIHTQGSHVRHHAGAGDSSCFYFEGHDLSMLLGQMLQEHEKPTARFCRIEVTSGEGGLHKHAGPTFVIITSGSGIFRDADGDHQVRAGGAVYVPPMAAHLSIADKDTTMIEWVVYIGATNDFQESLPA